MSFQFPSFYNGVYNASPTYPQWAQPSYPQSINDYQFISTGSNYAQPSYDYGAPFQLGYQDSYIQQYLPQMGWGQPGYGNGGWNQHPFFQPMFSPFVALNMMAMMRNLFAGIDQWGVQPPPIFNWPFPIEPPILPVEPPVEPIEPVEPQPLPPEVPGYIEAQGMLERLQKVGDNEKAANKDGDAFFLSAADRAELKQAITDGKFTGAQLAEAITHMLRRGGNNANDEYRGMVRVLVDEGVLPPGHLLTNFSAYTSLGAKQKGSVLAGIAGAGLFTGPNQTYNKAFWENYVAKGVNSSDPQRRNTSRDLMIRAFSNVRAKGTAAEKKQMAELMRSVGFKINDNLELTPGAARPFPIKITYPVA